MTELRQRIQDVIENEPVAVFMKGTPQFVMCGNSDPAIRQELSEISGWPTIPQVFVKGELIGGADITQELAASGELTRVLEEKLGPDYRSSAGERTVSLLTPA